MARITFRQAVRGMIAWLQPPDEASSPERHQATGQPRSPQCPLIFKAFDMPLYLSPKIVE